jgi:hypothetical protein
MFLQALYLIDLWIVTATTTVMFYLIDPNLA